MTTRKVLLTFILGVSICLGAFAQNKTLSEYLSQRDLYGVHGVEPLETLSNAENDRVVEVRGSIKGYASGADRFTLMLDMEQKTIMIAAPEVPDWMKAGAVSARLLVHVTRENEYVEPHYQLLAAVSDQMISKWEAEHKPKPAPAKNNGKKVAKVAAPSRGSRQNQIASRGGTIRSSVDTVFDVYASYIARANSRLSAQQVKEITSVLLKTCEQCGIDARLVVAMISCESGFNPNATSRAGARGLGQLMPRTAAGMGVTDIYDIEQNITAAIQILSGHMQTYGNKTNADWVSWDQVKLTLASYNAGSGAVKKYGGVPPYKETQNYVRNVIALYKKLCNIS